MIKNGDISDNFPIHPHLNGCFISIEHKLCKSFGDDAFHNNIFFSRIYEFLKIKDFFQMATCFSVQFIRKVTVITGNFSNVTYLSLGNPTFHKRNFQQARYLNRREKNLFLFCFKRFQNLFYRTSQKMI